MGVNGGRMAAPAGLALAMLSLAGAHAQPSSPDDGARPGNIIGTGMSLPRSNDASNIDAATTRSRLEPNLPSR